MGTWWRGEAVGVDSIPPDKTADHDIGDGMYLTNNRSSAIQYAELRTNDLAARRVYSVNIDESSMRILNLATDARWAKDLRFVEPSIKAANVNYGRVFANFVKANRINLNEYDAVMGLDYLRGGQQMCILFKNGQQSPLQNALRGNFKSESIGGPPHDSNSIARRIPGGPSGFGAGAKVVGLGVVELALTILGAKIREWSDGLWLERGMRDIEPKIAGEARKHAAAIADLQLKGQKAFANITIEVWRTHDHVNETGQTIDSVPVVHLNAVFVSANDINLDQGKTKDSSSITIYQYTYSGEVTVSSEERNLYKALMMEYQFFDRQATLDPGNLSWSNGRSAMRTMIIHVFGQEAAVDVLDSWMWPKFKYRGTPLKR